MFLHENFNFWKTLHFFEGSLLRCANSGSCALQGADSLEDDIDWWSKYYASTGELDKCKMYLEQGFDKLQVCVAF